MRAEAAHAVQRRVTLDAVTAGGDGAGGQGQRLQQRRFSGAILADEEGDGRGKGEFIQPAPGGKGKGESFAVALTGGRGQSQCTEVDHAAEYSMATALHRRGALRSERPSLILGGLELALDDVLICTAVGCGALAMCRTGLSIRRGPPRPRPGWPAGLR